MDESFIDQRPKFRAYEEGTVREIALDSHALIVQWQKQTHRDRKRRQREPGKDIAFCLSYLLLHL